MNAAYLCETAQMMRDAHGPDHERHDMWAAIASWLDSVALDAGQRARNASRWTGSDIGADDVVLPHDAVNVARAYREAEART